MFFNGSRTRSRQSGLGRSYGAPVPFWLQCHPRRARLVYPGQPVHKGPFPMSSAEYVT
jgi:hypothetical protein